MRLYKWPCPYYGKYLLFEFQVNIIMWKLIGNRTECMRFLIVIGQDVFQLRLIRVFRKKKKFL